MSRFGLISIMIAWLAGGSANASTRPLILDAGYLQPSGAIMTYYGARDFIDPYFPTMALLTAHDNGMNVSHVANGWINWLLPRQEANGLFSIFCNDQETNNYRACLNADADDAMMAMWIDLLYRTAPTSGMPAAWMESTRKAENQLESLYDRESGVYFISHELPVGLLMDNVEIYASLKRASLEAKRLGVGQQAALFSLKAARLKTGIIKTFWDEDAQRFKPSTQKREAQDFYPDVVAQLMPALRGFELSLAGAPEKFYRSWMQSHRTAWMDMVGKEYPWGLVAIAATQHNDMDTANCWFQQAAPHRNTDKWDVLDEAAFQAVEIHLLKKWQGGPPTCQKAAS